MTRPILFPDVKGLAPQKQIYGFGQPLAYDRARDIVRVREIPTGISESVTVIFLVLDDTSRVMNSAAIIFLIISSPFAALSLLNKYYR